MEQSNINIKENFLKAVSSTTNKVKANFFSKHGLNIIPIDDDIDEVNSRSIIEVAYHKAKDCPLKNVIVDDTSLTFTNTDFFSTKIKQLWPFVDNREDLNNMPIVWSVALAWKFDNHIIVSTGELEGFYDNSGTSGYHFERIIRINDKSYGDYTEEQKEILNPRTKAMNKLLYAIETNDLSQVFYINQDNISPWIGEYQETKITDPSLCTFNKTRTKINSRKP